jgi:hypothetical protein
VILVPNPDEGKGEQMLKRETHRGKATQTVVEKIACAKPNNTVGC